MSYQVLARKYRPKNFTEVMGQEHVTQTLHNAITTGRIHHAYLFCGVRGVGKTSLARILAKSLNCEQGPSITPCEQCAQCLDISAGRSLNVMEIDGASNTSVEHVRELREQVKYLPAGARYKIYIIDEVHMLSTSAFNALLKTLEEPPSHVIFLFATTEVHKIPITILSRCQRFNLRRIAHVQIEQRLREICNEEKIVCDEPSIKLIAKMADGSMRDAQSLLDMAINLNPQQINYQQVSEMLGLTQEAQVLQLAEVILIKNIAGALSILQNIYEQGYDLKLLAKSLINLWHDLILLKSVGDTSLQEERSHDQLTMLKSFVETISLCELQILFQITYRHLDELDRSEIPKIIFDILLVKLIHGTPFVGIQELAKNPQFATSQTVTSISTQPLTTGKSEPVAVTNRILPPVPVSGDWKQWLKPKPAILASLEHAKSVHVEGNILKIVFVEGSMWYDNILDRVAEIEKILLANAGQVYKVNLSAVPAQHAVKSQPQQIMEVTKQDTVVAEAVQIFNAKVERIKQL